MKVLQWLGNHKSLNLVLVLAYGVALIFLHDYFVQLSNRALADFGVGVYNKIVLVCSVCAGAAFLAYVLFLLFRNAENRNRKLFFLLLTTVLIALHYKFLFEMNIEVVHVVEFTVLSVLLFPVCGSFGASVVFTLPFIFVNEWYQYVVLYPHYIHYFEFNDVVIDLLGCGMAMVFLWIAGVKPQEHNSVFIKKVEVVFLVTINVMFVILLASCVFSLYPETKCDNTFMVLNQLENPHLFWQKHYFGAIYHVMKPIEGLLAINIVCSFFMLMDYAAGKN